ncbi:hypothetical protein A2303_04735 [Candidatus Falkowbacteria bacterium RIFOXYB2_FULL_47_14]|uniref:Transketolase-like pyrimidine-binding domain-containing protein n=1 Tax=Candidatus Falkowbacteria bacterium RIFOXYA2_FULL_47_19 TaxID=1797994 RepID=A0A1F5SH79_9BACT|nr:MAG: hypothetical protein A2227_02570 [Candidatus Falkowbacteria bacterium RIFOXYA2_FULL_47_19]OGF35808.1 MAG: hypothetical protein A2468_03755 [Candidatus Falkowbacteria bacterium RIFOXYC2_FULL_46_15]OGF42681.1 MAG: hypothetical protein A2303_04735 [Candidatus Falkowbacteria bacterium RIFOXYB2_FULL_47_14]
MRKQFVNTIENILTTDERLVLLLGDIGVWGFNKALALYPERVYNIGILEQSTVGLAAGLAMSGFIPVIHTIAPFLVERSYEQLKLDFCYQKMGGNFLSIGGSYDYAALGCTHHCPGDVGILKNLPGMEIILPGTAQEFDTLFRDTYANGHPTYFRLSDRPNKNSYNVKFGKAEILQRGNLATIVAVGPTLNHVLEACTGMDVTILYYTTVTPFDSETLKNNSASGKILLCEPYYKGGLTAEIAEALSLRPIVIDSIGVPKRFLSNYGSADEHDLNIGLSAININKKLKKLIYG